MRDLQKMPVPVWRLPVIAKGKGQAVSARSANHPKFNLSGVTPSPTGGTSGPTPPPSSKTKIDAGTDLPTLQKLLKEAVVKPRSGEPRLHELVLDAEIDTRSISGIVFVVAAFIHYQMNGSLHRFNKSLLAKETIYVNGKKISIDLLFKRYRDLRAKDPSDIIWLRAKNRTTFLAMIPNINDILGRPNGRDVQRQFSKNKSRLVRDSFNELKQRASSLRAAAESLLAIAANPASLGWLGKAGDLHDTLEALHHRAYELACCIEDSHGADWSEEERADYLTMVRELGQVSGWLRGIEETLPENDPFVQEVILLLEDTERVVADGHRINQEMRSRLSRRGKYSTIRMPSKRLYSDTIEVKAYPDRIPHQIGTFEEMIIRFITNLVAIIKKSEALMPQLQERINAIGE
ncbi:MAG: hypothetical protein HQ542_07065 [Bacteroidia bacterium]|nr:hypothetical protein [Bacteroidia bacterium]